MSGACAASNRHGAAGDRDRDRDSDSQTGSEAAAPQPPALRIVRGEPSAEEVAALTALLAASSGGDEPAPGKRRGGWNDPAAQHRSPGLAGPNGWRAAYRP